MKDEALLNSTPKDEREAPEAKENDSKSFILAGSDKKIMNLQLFLYLQKYYYKLEKLMIYQILYIKLIFL
jgi:hypothetical protein